MDLNNINFNEIINKGSKKCGYCGKELKPKGLDYLYANIPEESIEYERCTCEKSKEYWTKKDYEDFIKKRKKKNIDLINKIFNEKIFKKKIEKYNLNNFIVNEFNKNEVKIVKDYTQKCLDKKQDKGLIIIGKSGVGKTYLACAIANQLMQNGQVVLVGRLANLLDKIKDSFSENTITEKELIELYSGVDMIVIDDLGIEKITKWALDKFYIIIENRNENGLPIVITTKLSKDKLMQRFSEVNDEILVESVISKLYEMCYGITLKNEKKSA